MDILKLARWRIRVAAVAAVLFLGCALPAIADDAPASPRFTIVCQYLDSPTTVEKLRRTWRWVRFSHSIPVVDPTLCPKGVAEKPRLVGPGDIIVVVGDADYASALKLAGTNKLRLFLNGFDLGADGALVSVVRNADKVALRFHAGSNNPKAQAFWSSVYQQQGIVAAGPLQATVGWGTEPAFMGAAKTELLVSVTSGLPLISATLLGGALVLFFWWALRNSDTFRVAPLYPWWNDARALRTKARKAALPVRRWRRGNQFDVSKYQKEIAGVLVALYPDFAWPTSAELNAYRSAAAAALAGGVTHDDAQFRTTVIGLAISEKYWKPPRLPYSLARVQWGTWVMFSVAAAIYLWLVYGEFPALAGSVLGLVTISTATAGGSFIVDQGKGTCLAYSNGFVSDLMTGNDGVQQAHRYQAIVVNIVLLVVGLMYVVQHLLYPTFDPTWLGLLGVSGVAQTVGKQVLEKPT